jgi:hypothetical protein
MNIRATDDFVRICPETSAGSFMYSNVTPKTVWWAGRTRYSPYGMCTLTLDGYDEEALGKMAGRGVIWGRMK